MLKPVSFAILIFCLVGCQVKSKVVSTTPVKGTWRLLSGTIIENGDTTTTVYSDSLAMIKIINDSHFAFLNHDTYKGKDSTALFIAGGGKYDFADGKYIEHLEYCSDRQWEGHDFEFTVTVQDDTLIQTGVEAIEEIGVNRLNIEKYVRVK